MDPWHYVYVASFIVGMLAGASISIIATLYVLELQRQRAERRWLKDIDSVMQQWLEYAQGNTANALRIALHRIEGGETDERPGRDRRPTPEEL